MSNSAEDEGVSRYIVERLTSVHDVSSFNCGNQLLDYYLQNKALDETERDLSCTHVLIDRESQTASKVAGFFTLRADSIYDAQRSADGQNTLSVVELAYLARDLTYKRQGIGEYLLIEVLFRTAQVAEVIGVAGIHLAYTTEGKPLYERFGFGAHAYGEYNLLLSMADIRILLDL